jgi:hypothetical protein
MTSRILKIAIAAAILSGSSMAFAKDGDSRFERDGYTYVYNVTEQAGTRQIRGKYYPGARSFALEVRNSRVAGTVNGSGVSFPLSAIEGQKASGALASAD